MLEGKSYSENQIYYGVLNLKKNHARVFEDCNVKS